MTAAPQPTATAALQPTVISSHRRPHPRPRRPPRSRRSLLRVADWRVRTKLVAVLVIPSLAFLAVAGLTTSASVRQAAALDGFADRVALSRQVTELVHELQFERDRVSGELAALGAAPAADRAQRRPNPVGTPERAAADRATADFRAAVAPLRADARLRPAIVGAEATLDQLAAVRAGVAEGWLSREAVFAGYTRAIGALLALLPEPAQVEQAEVRGYRDLSAVKELGAQIRGELFAVLTAGRPGPGTAERIADVRAQRRAALQRFRASATPAQLARYDEVVRGQAVRASARLEQAAVDQIVTGRPAVDPDQWWSAATTELELVREVERELLAGALAQTRQLSLAQWQQIAGVTAATVLIMLVALYASVRIGRSMARSLRHLHRQAVDVAQVRLPGLLARLRGPLPDGPPAEEVVPTAVAGADEVGEVAEAFTQVHRSAVRLAVEQATMRRNVNAIMVNLARRSQSLVERQLELLDELEHGEAEPAQLSNLFRLDHLATRMRRNNESLLVLTGTDSSRRYPEAVSLATVALAALAEIEHYQRVRHDVADEVHVVGHVVADLVHLFAELLDNATAFSAKDTTVSLTVRGRAGGPDRAAGGPVLVEIADAGLGMSGAALEEANVLLGTPPPVDLAASERMGLVVVSHLAARHGVRVRLRAADPGVVAAVLLPARLLAAAPPPLLPAPAQRELVGAGPAGPPTSAPASAPEPGQPAIASAAAATTGVGAPRRLAVRAEDVLESAGHAPSAWWSRAGGAVPAGPNHRVPGPAGGPGSMQVTGGTSARGLPIRVPMAQLRPGGPPPAAARPAADPDPDEVGSTLSRYYRGVRRAEAEETAGGQPERHPVPGPPDADPAGDPAPGPAPRANPAENGEGADGESAGA